MVFVSPLIVTLGFICGGILLYIGDKIFPKIIKKHDGNNRIKRTIMLVLSIGIHNIPEGLAVGVAFGALRYNIVGDKNDEDPQYPATRHCSANDPVYARTCDGR